MFIQENKNKLAAKGKRASVSAEAYGKFNVKEDYIPKKILKTNDQRLRILNKMKMSFMFNSLEENDLNKVIDAFEEIKFNAGEYVIKQGDQGNVLYLVESGKLDCIKQLKTTDTSPTWLKLYEPGETFGELALLYNSPRAASIIAQTDCVLWALDRETFNHIVKDSAMY